MIYFGFKVGTWTLTERVETSKYDGSRPQWPLGSMPDILWL